MKHRSQTALREKLVKFEAKVTLTFRFAQSGQLAARETVNTARSAVQGIKFKVKQ